MLILTTYLLVYLLLIHFEFTFVVVTDTGTYFSTLNFGSGTLVTWRQKGHHCRSSSTTRGPRSPREGSGRGAPGYYSDRETPRPSRFFRFFPPLPSPDSPRPSSLSPPEGSSRPDVQSLGCTVGSSVIPRPFLGTRQ